MNDQLISHSTRDAMWAAQKVADGSRNDYALGWSNLKVTGVAVVGHSGNQPGASTAILLAPEQLDGVVVLINMDGVDASALAAELLEIMVRTPAGGQGKRGWHRQDCHPTGN